MHGELQCFSKLLILRSPYAMGDINVTGGSEQLVQSLLVAWRDDAIAKICWKATTSQSGHSTISQTGKHLRKWLSTRTPPKKVLLQKVHQLAYSKLCYWVGVKGWKTNIHTSGNRVTSWPSFWNSQFTLVLVLDSASSGRARPTPWSSMRMVSSSGRP